MSAKYGDEGKYVDLKVRGWVRTTFLGGFRKGVALVQGSMASARRGQAQQAAWSQCCSGGRPGSRNRAALRAEHQELADRQGAQQQGPW